jgi:hypothetical protein
MLKVHKLLVLSIVISGFNLSAEEEYPIKLFCEKDNNMLDVRINMNKNIAYFSYKQGPQSSIEILEDSGYTTRAYIRVETSQQEYKSIMQLTGSETRTFRYSYFSNFNVTISREGDMIQSVKAAYSNGVEESPDNNNTLSFYFDGANCSLITN